MSFMSEKKSIEISKRFTKRTEKRIYLSIVAHHHRPFVMSPAPEPAPAPSASPLLKPVSFVVVCLTAACFLLCIIQTPVQWFFVYNPLGLLPASLNHMAGVSQTKKETDYETVRTKDIYLPRNKNDGLSNNGLFLPGAEWRLIIVRIVWRFGRDLL